MATKLLKASEVRELLGVSNPTIYRWMRSGKLESIKLGGVRRIPEDALERFINEARGIDPTPDVQVGEQNPRKLARELGISLAEAKRRVAANS